MSGRFSKETVRFVSVSFFPGSVFSVSGFSGSVFGFGFAIRRHFRLIFDIPCFFDPFMEFSFSPRFFDVSHISILCALGRSAADWAVGRESA